MNVTYITEHTITELPAEVRPVTYINGKYLNTNVETVDEFPTRKEARAAIAEYRVAFGGEWRMWLSQRSTHDWRIRT